MPVRVLLVDDSATARLALRMALAVDPEIVVVGEAATSTAALRETERLRPDLVTIDVHLGSEDGVDLAGRLMVASPVPILVVTGVDPGDPGLAFRAVQAGALDVVGKPPGPEDPRYPEARRRLARLVKALAGVPVVTRHAARPTPRPAAPRAESDACDVVALGASTGGPLALAAVLGALPKPFSLPVLVVQHLSDGFGPTFAAWLAQTTGHDVKVAGPFTKLRPGLVVVAPDGAHMVAATRGHVAVVDGPPRHFQRPSIDTTFESLARAHGATAFAALLTGMGNDGAAGLLELHRVGAGTAVQEPSTCVVDGMPRAALDLGAAQIALPPERLGALIASLPSGWNRAR